MKRNSIFTHFISLVLVILLSAGLIFCGFQIVGSTFLNAGDENIEEVSTKTITRNGKDYFPRQDITTVLFMGIDKEGPVEASGSYRNDGEVDVIFLMIFDDVDETYSVLCLNRDTMVTMPVLGIGGKKAGTDYAQLALSHTYGSGLEDSAENTKKTISDLINGVSIDYYIAANMDVISIVADAVGGIEVNVTDDFSEIDSSIKKGTQILTGEQALSFVRVRKGLGDQMNISRMDRQKEFLNGFMSAFKTKLDSSESFLRKTYEKMAEYLVSDCSINTLMNLSDKYSGYTLKEIIIPEGENKLGKMYMEYYLDEEAFDDLVVDTFYAEK